MKKIISSVLSVLLMSSSISTMALSYGTAADENGKIAVKLYRVIR